MDSHADVVSDLMYQHLRSRWCKACGVRPAGNGLGGYCPACSDEIRMMVDEVKPRDGDSYDDTRWEDHNV